MTKPRKKRRQSGGKRQIETALPKRHYKRTNRLLYVFSAVLLVVFGGGAALVGAGSPRGPVTPTPGPAVADTLPGQPAQPPPGFTVTPEPTATPTP